MKLLQQFLTKLRNGTATDDDFVRADRRAFLFGMTATATGLIVAPTVILPAIRPVILPAIRPVILPAIRPVILPAIRPVYLHGQGQCAMSGGGIYGRPTDIEKYGSIWVPVGSRGNTRLRQLSEALGGRP